MFQQMIGRVLRHIQTPKADPVVVDLAKPRTEFDEALDDVCHYIGIGFADSMNRSLTYRSYVEQLFTAGPYPDGGVSKLVSPFDGCVFTIIRSQARGTLGRYQVMVDGATQPEIYDAPFYARNEIVARVMKQRVAASEEVRATQDELARAAQSNPQQ